MPWARQHADPRADQHSLFAVRGAILLLTRQVMNSQNERQQTMHTRKATGKHSYQDNMAVIPVHLSCKPVAMFCVQNKHGGAWSYGIQLQCDWVLILELF